MSDNSRKTELDSTNSTDSRPLSAVLKHVGKNVSPTPNEQQEIDAATTTLTKRVQSAIAESTPLGRNAVEIVPAGSTTRGTFLAGDSDIDLFIRFPASIEERQLESFGLAVGEQAIPESRKEYADHPYITGAFDGFEVDIVPCFAVETAAAIQSPVDRTPFHTEYLSNALTDGLQHDIRIAKQFLKASEVYGANATTQGFSGFVTELLVLEYGGFEPFMRAAANWGKEEIIDIEGHSEVTKTFGTPLVVIDPVDPERNAAAAIAPSSKAQLMHSARQLLATPTIEAFETGSTETVSVEAAERFFKKRGTHPVALRFDTPELDDETLYPQLEKSLNGLGTLLKKHDFNPLRATVLAATDRTTAAFLFEFAETSLPAIERCIGPPIHQREASGGFMDAYEDDDSVTGPFLDENVLVVERERSNQTPEGLLEGTQLHDAQHGAQIEHSIVTAATTVVGSEKVARLATIAGMSDDLQSYITDPGDGSQSF